MILSYAKSFGIGLVAGMRSMMAPALVSHKLSDVQPALQPHSFSDYAANPTTAKVLRVMAAGELIGDKLPNASNRTDAPSFAFRVMSGGTCGALLSEIEGEPILNGAIAGGFGAAVGTFVFFRLRQWLDHELGIPDPIVALAEDALAITVGWLMADSIVPAPTVVRTEHL